MRVVQDPQRAINFLFLSLVTVTRFVNIVFQRGCMFSLSSLIASSCPLSPSHPAKEGLVILTEFMHQFWSRVRKVDRKRKTQRCKKRWRKIYFGKLNSVDKMSFAWVQWLRRNTRPTFTYQLFIDMQQATSKFNSLKWQWFVIPHDHMGC